MIEDETDQGFFLGINGYLQNAELTSSWHVSGLDTVPILVQIESDTVNFIKEIHLRDEAEHRYVLTYNSRGELKLRYRGTTHSATPEAVAWNEDIKWPEKWKPRGNHPPTPSGPVVLASAKPAIQPEPTPPDTEKDTIRTDESVLLPGNEVVDLQEEGMVVELPEAAEASDYQKLITALEKKQYEFDRLRLAQEYLKNHSVSVEELKKIFSIVKYDNTRLQLFDTAFPKLIDPAAAHELVSTMEYDISQQKIKERLNEK